MCPGIIGCSRRTHSHVNKRSRDSARGTDLVTSLWILRKVLSDEVSPLHILAASHVLEEVCRRVKFPFLSEPERSRRAGKIRSTPLIRGMVHCDDQKDFFVVADGGPAGLPWIFLVLFSSFVLALDFLALHSSKQVQTNGQLSRASWISCWL
jgi:hypothetical protein